MLTYYIKPFRLQTLIRNGGARSVQIERTHKASNIFLKMGRPCHTPLCAGRHDWLPEFREFVTNWEKKRPAYKVAERIEKRLAWIAERNLERAKAFPETLLELGSGCLRWHECLPLGVEPQVASNLTGVSFWHDRWVGQEQLATHYVPKNSDKAPKEKRIARAKKI